mgnify:CR=1 FL=1
MTKVAIVGTGYVGLTTGACLAHLGHEVVCADVNEEKVALLSRGEIPFLEDELDDLVAEGTSTGRLRFVVGAKAAVVECEVAFLCVPTPQNPDGSADLTFIEKAARDIVDVLPSKAILVNKSTVPIGTARVVEEVLERIGVPVVSNPEFLREGSAVQDFLHPDRIVIGTNDPVAGAVVAALYEGVLAPVVVTDPVSSETIKYAANAFLATRLSFVNAIAAVCEGVGANVDDVIMGLGYDSRIGSDYLRPGPGWGGSCLPKDTNALVRIAEDVGYDFRFLKGVIEVNEEQFSRVVAKVRRAVGGELEGREVAIWGLTFKAGTDDLRDSPALEILSRLVSEGPKIRAYDPTVGTNTLHSAGLDGLVELSPDSMSACDGAAVLIVLTDWDEFGDLDPLAVAARMTSRAVVDGRNTLDKISWQRAGFDYQGIGC